MPQSPFDHPLASARYFFPRPDRFDDPFWVDCDGGRLGCRYLAGHPDGPTVIHFHGNGEIVSDYFDPFLPLIRQLGCNCLLAEYRGYGMSTGAPSLGSLLADVEPLVAATGQPPEKLVLFGRSVGSIPAIHAAWRYPGCAGLIIESGIADPLERLLMRVSAAELGSSEEALRAEAERVFDHRRKLAGFRGATLVMHARGDSLVDVSNAERLHRWAPEPRTLELFELGDHNSVLFLNLVAYFDRVRSFIESL